MNYFTKKVALPTLAFCLCTLVAIGQQGKKKIRYDPLIALSAALLNLVGFDSIEDPAGAITLAQALGSDRLLLIQLLVRIR